MPAPLNLNMQLRAAQDADQVDPSRRELQLCQRVRAITGDMIDGAPLALVANQLDLSTNPTATDTITIDGEVYEFVATAGAVASDDNIAVEIGASAADTFADLLAAINGTAPAAHANITDVATTGAALGAGTKPVFAADLGSQVLGLYYTNAQNLNPANMGHDDYASFPSAYPSFAVSNTLTTAVSFSAANFNVLPVANPSVEVNGMVALRIDVVTALLDTPLLFTFAGGTNIVGCVASPKTATGIPAYWDAATFHVSSGSLTVTLATTGAVDPANGEFCDIILFGQFAGIQA